MRIATDLHRDIMQTRSRREANDNHDGADAAPQTSRKTGSETQIATELHQDTMQARSTLEANGLVYGKRASPEDDENEGDDAGDKALVRKPVKRRG